MKKHLTIFLFLSFLTAQGQEQKPAFKSGEWLRYKMSYSGFLRAGTAVLEVEEKEYQGKKVFHTKGTGWTSGMIKWFFEVEDYYESYFDKENRKQAIETSKVLEVSIKNNYLKLFVKGFFLNFINIGVLTFWLGAVLVIGPSLDMSRSAIFSYFGFIILGYFATDLGKIFLAKRLKAKITPAIIFRIKRIMGVILIVCGVFLMIKGFIPNEHLNQFIN